MLVALLSTFTLTALAKDLHHLAMIIPILAIGLEESLKKESKKIRLVLMSCLAIAYGIHIIQGDKQLKSISTPTFGKSKQMKMLERLQVNKVETLITMDYEIYGIIEILDPQIDVIHAWGAISIEGYNSLPKILQKAKGGHLIVCDSSMPMIYNLHPPLSLLRSMEQDLSITIDVVDKWEGVMLYKVK